jgi:hypothetical protein
MYFETRKTRIYKDIYRPSSKISNFLGTILSVIIMGQSPVSNQDNHHLRKSR